MKKFLGLIVVVLSVFLIYLGFKDNKVYYLNLGDGLAKGATPYGGIDYGFSDYVKDYLDDKGLLETFVNQFSQQNYRTTDLTKAIKDNVRQEINGKEKTIQNALIKADLITLSIGNSELLLNLELSEDFGLPDLAKRFDGYIADLEALFTIVREYSKEDIIFIGFYDPTNNEELTGLFTNLNNKIKELCIKYKIEFVDTYNMFFGKKYISNDNNIYPTKEGYKAIADSVIKIVDSKFAKK